MSKYWTFFLFVSCGILNIGAGAWCIWRMFSVSDLWEAITIGSFAILCPLIAIVSLLIAKVEAEED